MRINFRQTSRLVAQARGKLHANLSCVFRQHWLPVRLGKVLVDKGFGESAL